jgi:hypothetical protein|tara:strand:+ start:72 stop:656 length:585 start_codon:yes stop_codon:yes gene_type:complete
MALLSVDTLYTTYDTYTSADALDYAESPSTIAEKTIDSSTYFTKVKSLTVGDNYGYERNVYVAATLDSGLTSGVTSTVAISVTGSDSFPSSGHALVGAEVIFYATTTEDGQGVTTDLNTLTRALASTVDVTHAASQRIYGLVDRSIVTIEHNEDLEVFNINTKATATSSQFSDLVYVDMFTIPETSVAMVKYAA